MAERFGPYEILRKIATGGMAEVFLAKQSGMGGFERLVCIKRILSHLGEQEDFIKMFQDEARIAANLIHPNIAQIYDIGEISGSYYIAMEYVRGEDLRRIYNQEVARGRAMPPEPAAQIVMGAASGLDYAHRQTSIDGKPLGLVHRDISPQNILVTYDGHVKLVDFGVAKAAGKMTETRSGVLKGKYSYMSPEQASGDPIDGRTDIFALGITLYEVTTGVRLFKRENELETLHAVIECKVTPPSQIIPGYDSSLEEIVLKALAHDQDERYPSAGEMERDLERFLVRRSHPTGSSALASYMQDLFAEKLADEVLFGGAPWESMTPSRQRGTRQLENSGSPAKSHSTTEATEIGGKKNAEDTVVDNPELSISTSAIDVPKHISMGDDWGSGTGSESQTATRPFAEHLKKGHGAPPSDSPQFNAGANSRPQSAPKPQSERWFQWLAIGILLVGVLTAVVSIALTKRYTFRTAPRSGPILVDSEPRGARISFVGENVASLNKAYTNRPTPFTISEGLPLGLTLKIRFSKDGYEVTEKLLPTLERDTPATPLFAELRRSGDRKGTLILLTQPAGAEAWVDGNRVPGKTPLNDIQVPGGTTHRVEFHLPGYFPSFESIFVEPGARRFVEKSLIADPNAKLKPTQERPAAVAASSNEPAGDAKASSKSTDKGYLMVTSPLKLQVALGNKNLGDTPVKKQAVEPGSYKLRLESPSEGFVIYKTIRVGAGETESVEMKPKRGNLSVNATPWAFVKVGNGSQQETPARLSVYEGEYHLQFECPDGKKKKENAYVNPGQTTSIAINCRD